MESCAAFRHQTVTTFVPNFRERERAKNGVPIVRPAVSGSDIQLKFSLSAADLLSVIRGVKSETPANGSSDSHSHITAQFSSLNDTISLSGLVHNRQPIYFVLKPGSRTYWNFVQFMLQELAGVSELARTAGQPLEENGAAHQAVERLVRYLQTKLDDLRRETEQHVSDLNEIVEMFGGDFELTKKRHSAMLFESREKSDPQDRRVLLKRIELPVERRFRLFRDGELNNQVMSGFLSLEIDEVTQPFKGNALLGRLLSSFKFTGAPAVTVEDGHAIFTARFEVDPSLLPWAEIAVHWGSIESAEPWVDDEVSSTEITQDGVNAFVVRKVLAPRHPGAFSATLSVQCRGTRHRLWPSDVGFDDAAFQVTTFPRKKARSEMREAVLQTARQRGDLLHAISDFDTFTRTLDRLVRREKVRAVEKIVHDIAASDPELRQLLAQYFSMAMVEQARRSPDNARPAINTVANVLQNIGIGEIVLVSPEGPHAIAGGIAQVITGLMEVLSRRGLSVTLIAPLYEEEQGNKHRGAERLIREGIPFGDRRIQLSFVGEVRVPFGPVLRSGSEQVLEPSFLAASKVYEAQEGTIRFLLIRHPRFADRLYPTVSGDEQLRRAIFLSRGALEVIADDRFEISPSVIISNDWLAGPIPLYLKTDPRYASDAALSRARTIHVIHNCGMGYQGRFYANQHGEDLWPLFGLGSQHYFGATDPNDRSHLNLTAAAVYHTTGALLTVSRPYAEQLLTANGAEGLERMISGKRGMLFGISNGVDLSTLRRVFWQIGEHARAESQLEPLIPERASEKKILKNLVAYKQVTKQLLQKRYGLRSDPDAILISLVGRIAEQKGISLLGEPIAGEGITPLESVLKRYEKVQFLIGGPVTAGDPAVERFRKLTQDLEERFPDRFRAVFDFILHRDAMEITAGSDLFLMPSRYEPGGITQLEALSVGTLVIARNVGGISATLLNYRDIEEEGNSFLFDEYTPRVFRNVVARAIEVIRNPKKHRRLMTRAALAEHDWEHRVHRYLALLQYVAGVIGHFPLYPHLESKERLLEEIRPRTR